MNITGNTIFIPGATSGIGLALALALDARGNTVIVGGRRSELLESIAAEHPGIGTVSIDTADAASIAAASKEVIANYPDLNVLVPMAGIMRIENWHSAEGFLASAESTIQTNLLGPIRLIAAFTEQLQSQPDSTIVSVSSGVAFTPLGGTPSYNASKAAIHLLSESLRLQLSDTSVSIIELVPPSVRTALVPGHENDPHAVPLDTFVAEVMQLLESQPEATEINVEAVKPLRFAEVNGQYTQMVAALNGLN
jgi:short-subunit dehydrogenase involved in D-alanine esterification of teichoic acids